MRNLFAEKIEALNVKAERVEKEALQLKSAIDKKYKEAQNLFEGYKKYEKDNTDIAANMKKIFEQKVEEVNRLKDEIDLNRSAQQKIMQETQKLFVAMNSWKNRRSAVQKIIVQAARQAKKAESVRIENPVKEKIEVKPIEAKKVEDKKPAIRPEPAAVEVPAVRSVPKKEENLYSKAHSAQEAEAKFMAQMARGSRNYGAA